MKLISWNANGIRAVERKGAIQKLIVEQTPDILFIQEIKAQKEQLSSFLTEHPIYFQDYHSAEKKGYSGVGVWYKKDIFEKKPIIYTGMDNYKDTEGRIIRFSISNFDLIGVYFPNGGKSHEAWLGKIEFYKKFLIYINFLREKKRNIIWCGDLNVAHREIDLARPKENKNSIGFLPEERTWVDSVIENNWIDTFRFLHPDKISYTWWDMPSKARERNVGWRIDYFFIDKQLENALESVEHLNEHYGSDHCPIILNMNFKEHLL